MADRPADDASAALLGAWLEARRPGAAARWSPVLLALPARPTFDVPRARGAAGALQALEWSVREGGDEGLRFAFTLDTDRLPAGWVPALCRRADARLAAPWVDALSRLIADDHGVGLLFGLDHPAEPAAPRAKLYLYPSRRHPLPTLLAALDGAGVRVPPLAQDAVFAALDLVDDGPPTLKLYLGPPDRDAAAARLRAAGAPALADLAATLPSALDRTPHGLVVTVRERHGAPVDVTLHAAARALPDLPSWLGPELAATHRALDGEAARLGARLTPTHLSWLARPGPQADAPTRTLYYALAAAEPSGA